MYHPVAFTLWVVAAAALALGTRNPFYLALLLGCVVLSYRAARQYNPRAAWGGILRLGLWVWAVTIPFNALSAHMGRYVIFTLPRSWPLIGGPVTAEGALFGFLNGLSLVLLLNIFAAFNTAVDQYQLLRLVPSAFHQVGMIASIAVTFIPVMATTFEEIRQAQMLRGHRFRGIRDLLPLLAPLLASGLERSIQLAEAMEARGYGGNARPLSPAANAALQSAMLLGLLGLIAGLFLRVYTVTGQDAGTGIAAVSLAMVLGTLWLQGRRLRRSVYRVWRWDHRSIVVASGSALSLAAVVSAPAWLGTGLAYYPYPPGSLMPRFSPLLAAAILLLALPGVIWSPPLAAEAGIGGR